MPKNEKINKVIDRLNDIAKDRQSFFRDDGDDEIFREDYAALCEAVEMLTRYKELSKAEEEKRLVLLPCKPGSTIYEIENGKIQPKSFAELSVDEGGVNVFVAEPFCDGYCQGRNLLNFGKTIFLTYAEAEAALKNSVGDCNV